MVICSKANFQRRAKTVKIASFLAASIFNESYESLLKMMHIMNIIIGPNAVALCTEVNDTRISMPTRDHSKPQKREESKEDR